MYILIFGGDCNFSQNDLNGTIQPLQNSFKVTEPNSILHRFSLGQTVDGSFFMFYQFLKLRLRQMGHRTGKF